MAFKLDRNDEKRRAQYIELLTEARSALEDAISVYNAKVEDLKAPVNEAIGKYNEALEEARGWVEDIGNTADGEFDDKSERWQDGDKGQAARTWIETWQGAEMDDFEIEFPDELSSDLPEHVETLENLPPEPEE